MQHQLLCCVSDLGCHLQSGEQITALDDLQDIDELHVTEVVWYLLHPPC